MNWKRAILNLIYPISATIIVLIDKVLPSGLGGFQGILFFIIILFLIVITDQIKERLTPETPKILRNIINDCARNAFEITTIHDFLVETKEESLNAGDEVHILTNSLEGYDATRPAVKVISQNLEDGVKYLYYLPAKEFPALTDETSDFVAKIFRERSTLPPSVINSNLVFFEIDEECIYNFAIVKTKGTVRGYWYITTPSSNDPKLRQLVIMEMANSDRDRLLKLMKRFSHSRRLYPLEKGASKHYVVASHGNPLLEARQVPSHSGRI